MSETKKHRVAMTVFAEIEADYEWDAQAIVRYAIRNAFLTASTKGETTIPVTIPAEVRLGTFDVRVVKIMETSSAAGNGYLWVGATSKAFGEAE